MIFISHRGNTDGPIPVYENHPEYISVALRDGFEVEVDVWYIEKKFWLGHDRPVYEVETWWLTSAPLWCHAKTIEALNMLLDINAHCFFHNTDAVTLTSRACIWTYPGFPLTVRSIEVDPEGTKSEYPLFIAGVCSDRIRAIRNAIQRR